MRVGLDVDEVLYPFVDSLRQYLVGIRGYSATSLPVPQEWKFYNTWGLTEKEFNALCHEAADEGWLFSQAPLDGVIPLLEWTRSTGVEVHLITSRLHGPDPLAQTLDWVDMWSIPCDYVHVTDNKHLIDIDTILDDRIETVVDLRSRDIDACLLRTAHTPPNAKEILGWENIVDTLEEYLTAVVLSHNFEALYDVN
jgi:hypothetical protein